MLINNNKKKELINH